MRKLLLPWLLFVFPLLAQGQQPFAYSIRGRIGRVAAPARVYLRCGRQILDSTEVRDGCFAFQGSSPFPRKVLLWLLPTGRLPPGYRGNSYVSGDYRVLFLEPTPVVLTGTDLEHARVRGGPVNSDFDCYTARQLAFWARQHSDHALEQEEARPLNRLARQLMREFIRNNPASWVSLDVLTSRQLGPPQYDEVAPLYAALSPALRGSEPGRAYGVVVEQLKEVALGAAAPDFTLPDATGRPVTLAAYRGRYVLVEFWSLRCDACQGERGHTLPVYRKYANRHFALLSVALDEAAQRRQWLSTLASYPVDWPQLLDTQGFERSEVARRYHLDSLNLTDGQPQNFLLDPAGKIIGTNLYGVELDAALARLLPPFSPPR